MVSSAPAQLIYDNSFPPFSPPTILALTNNQIVGQQIAPNFANGTYLDNFTFEYYSAAVNSGSLSVNIKFYDNAGPTFNGYASPSSYFYDSGWISLVSPTPGGGYVLGYNLQWQDFYGGAPDFNNPSPITPLLAMNTQIALPSTFTVVFSFTGIDPGNNFGFQLYNGPAVGTNYGDYWVDSGGWGLYTNAVGPSGIGMQLVGSAEPVPEPSVVAMGVLGGLLMTRLLRRRQS
jgi:hypothetical protein